MSRYKLEYSNKPLHLNVGGTVLTVSLGHFLHNEREPDNLFEKMLTGEYPLYETPSTAFPDKVFFVDCELDVFKEIYNWLKYGTLGESKTNETLRINLKNQAKTFHLSRLVNELEKCEEEYGFSYLSTPTTNMNMMNCKN
ncbi:hypothetical protein FDP41_001759 [Naegleria fowleri]|uniref:BTB domain-containing protein n=1 Tax=Naegleria fowleri TaxID=5763 RepID=A0A6A5BVU9_NAEFO|nr:uncharacterized protein FDP41_001759 [Naegleria fowleri]KAF0979416.1 hypothetical protein FDP41_001759 [Naegleria fowleri]